MIEHQRLEARPRTNAPSSIGVVERLVNIEHRQEAFNNMADGAFASVKDDLRYLANVLGVVLPSDQLKPERG